MPFKLMGKSPLMKKLVGKQHKLPENLKAAIKAAPSKMKDLSGDGKITKKDVLIGRGVIKPDGTKVKSPAKFIPGFSQLFSSKPKKINYPVDSEGNRITAPNQQDLIDRKKLYASEEEKLFDREKQEQEKFEKEGNIKINGGDGDKPKNTGIKERTKNIAETKTDNGKTSKGKPFIYGRNNFGSTDGGVAAGIAMGKSLNIETPTSTVSENINKNVKDNVLVGSGSKKRLPIDAIQDRLTKNIDRRSRKADIRKQTRTAKKTLRQEGFKRSAAKDKVGKLGINPNTGKPFENAKQKQDFINARGKDTFVSDLQKKAKQTMKKAGIDPDSLNKKETKSDSKVPKLFGGEGINAFGGQSFGIATPKKKKVVKTPKSITNKSGVKTSNIDVQGIISKGRKAGDKISSSVTSKLKKDYDTKLKKDNKAKTDVEPTKRELTSNRVKPSKGQTRREVRRTRRDTSRQKKQGTKEVDRVTSLTRSKTNKSVVKDSKKPNVPSSISKVSTPKRPKFYDDQFDKREKEESKRITSPSRMTKKSPVKKTVGKFKVEKPPTPPTKLMKNKTPNKMMKKSPNKLMKKKSPNMMMKKKKSPTMMMKKKSSMKMMKKKK